MLPCKFLPLLAPISAGNILKALFTASKPNGK